MSAIKLSTFEFEQDNIPYPDKKESLITKYYFIDVYIYILTLYIYETVGFDIYIKSRICLFFIFICM